MGYRFLIFVAGVVLGVVIPLVVMGPYLFSHLSFDFASRMEIAIVIVLVIVGLWLVFASLLADQKEVDAIAESFQANEGFLLIVPYLMYTTSRSLWHRLSRRGGRSDGVL